MVKLVCLFCIVSMTSFSQVETVKDTCLWIGNNVSKANDGGVNLSSKCDLSEFKFELFNRWGSLVFETTEYSSPLDIDVNGKVGKKQDQDKYQQGVYYYKITYRTVGSRDSLDLTGYIQIL